MRILFVINGLRFGGMERQLVEVIKSLKMDANITYLAVLNTSGPFSEIVNPFLNEDIIYLDRHKSKIFKTILRILIILKRLKPDIIHVQDYFSAFYMLLPSKIMHIPFINGAIRNAGYTNGLVYLFEKVLLNFSNVVIANSRAGLNYYHINNGYVIYNFIDKNRFRETTESLLNIVMNANFTDKKDHLTLLTSCKKLLDEGSINKIGLIGDNQHIDCYRSIVKKWNMQESTIFYGHIENIEETLCDFGIGVLCSTKKYKEGISNSILEYMGAGLIVIGTNIGGTPEIIDNEINGFLYEPENPESLYKKIKYILNNPEKMNIIKQNAYKTLNEKFSAEKNCQKLMEIYESVSKI